jgi:divalent metal cation (Fe/Co/Zn/Cd) transporter
MTAITLTPSPARTSVLRRRVRLLVAATISYNVVEAIVAIAAGTVASSSALVGFGLDSTVEVASALAVAWQFSRTDHTVREATTLRLVGISFLALAVYVTLDSVHSLVVGAEADHSTVGIALAATSLVVMPGLSLLERRTGRELGSASVVANSKQTLICAYLSAVLLVGLLLNSTLGWAWADPAAALVIAAMAAREGVDALRGEVCCSTSLVDARSEDDRDDRCRNAG